MPETNRMHGLTRGSNIQKTANSLLKDLHFCPIIATFSGKSPWWLGHEVIIAYQPSDLRGRNNCSSGRRQPSSASLEEVWGQDATPAIICLPRSARWSPTPWIPGGFSCPSVGAGGVQGTELEKVMVFWIWYTFARLQLVSCVGRSEGWSSERLKDLWKSFISRSSSRRRRARQVWPSVGYGWFPHIVSPSSLLKAKFRVVVYP